MGIRRLSGLVPGFSASAPVQAMVLGLDATDKVSGVTAGASWAPISYSEVIRDVGGWWDSTNDEWTPMHTGLYIIHVQIKFDAEEYCQLRLYDVDAAARVFERHRDPNGDDSASATWVLQWWCEGGNTYSLDLYTTSTSLYKGDTYMWVTGPLVTAAA